MNSELALALVGIGGTLVASAFAQLLAARAETGRRAHEAGQAAARAREERRRARVAEVADVFDQLASALPKLSQAGSKAVSRLAGYEGPDTIEVFGELNDFRELREQAIGLHTRLILQLGREATATQIAGHAIEAASADGLEAYGHVTLSERLPPNYLNSAVVRRRAAHAAIQLFYDAAADYLDVGPKTAAVDAARTS